MGEQYEYRITGRRSEDQTQVTTLLLAGSETEAVQHAEDLGLDVDRVEYLRPVPTEPAEARTYHSAGGLIIGAIVLAICSMLLGLTGFLAINPSETRPIAVVLFGLSGLTHLIAFAILVVGLVRWAMRPLDEKIEQLRADTEHSPGSGPESQEPSK
jgi:fumarate reductase subunit D